MARRYLTVIQDPRGYPAPGAPLDKAPPDGPAQPVIHSVVLAEDFEALHAELKEAHSWMLAQGWCDCEYFEGAGTKPCRFAIALDERERRADA